MSGVPPHLIGLDSEMKGMTSKGIDMSSVGPYDQNSVSYIAARPNAVNQGPDQNCYGYTLSVKDYKQIPLQDTRKKAVQWFSQNFSYGNIEVIFWPSWENSGKDFHWAFYDFKSKVWREKRGSSNPIHWKTLKEMVDDVAKLTWSEDDAKAVFPGRADKIIGKPMYDVPVRGFCDHTIDIYQWFAPFQV